MPKLDTELHVKMFRAGKRRRSLTSRIRKAIKVLLGKDDVYGLEWGDPDVFPPLRHVRDHFVMPYLAPDKTVVEIGPGGGRWTRYMLCAKQIYAVDYHQEILNELKSNFDAANIACVKNHGDDFPNIPDGSVDFLFSFGTFVHLDVDLIDRYLRNMKPLLKPGSQVVIQYSDKTKPRGRSNEGFSENDPDNMRKLVLSHGYSIHEEDLETLAHSSIVRFGPPKVGTGPEATARAGK
ncbi:MAG TPA: class I SAM-dependent methyltransferase [Verrucomicrobiae bacterium]|nr:class I SAM-dependent methyltransferase [Verrucomicrobiae bacterium]